MDPVTEYTVITTLLMGVLLYFAWQLKKFQAYHLKRVLELLEEKHEAQKVADILERQNIDLRLQVARRDGALQRASTQVHQLSVALNASQRSFQRLVELSETQPDPQEDRTPKGSSRLLLITEDD